MLCGVSRAGVRAVGADVAADCVQASVPERHAQEMVVSWSNPDYDTALLLTQVTGNITSPYARHVSEFVRAYIDADGSQIWYDTPSHITRPARTASPTAHRRRVNTSTQRPLLVCDRF